MAVKQLGNTYLVANSTGGGALNDTDLAHRGWKDFLLWIDYVPPGVTPQVVVRAGNADVSDHDINMSLYGCDSLLDDPGDQVGETLCLCVPAKRELLTPVTETVSIPQTTGGKLYRFRIEPDSNHPLFTVEFKEIYWYSMECWEPRFNFYMFGRANTKDDEDNPITFQVTEQFFFVPNLQGEKARVRLQTEKGGENALLNIFKPTDEGYEFVVSCEVSGDDATEEQNPFFNSVEFDGPDTDPGAVYKFELTRAREEEETAQQCSGNTRVRFSRNIPPYFSNSPNRLIYPIIHREFEPVLYTEQEQNYRAYLTVERGAIDAVPTGSQIYIRVKGDALPSLPNAYHYDYPFTAPADQEQIKQSYLLAELVQLNAEMEYDTLAYSTDKVDTVYVVSKPEFGDEWDDKILLAYDNGNGSASATLANPGRFTTVQTNNQNTLDDIDEAGLKAMGVLYPGSPGEHPLVDWFIESEDNPNDSRVLMWSIFDEPDAGPPYDQEYYRNPVIKQIYNRLYYFKTRFVEQEKETTKPFGLNVMHPIFIEEYSKGADIVWSDPFVRPTTGENTKRITDCVTEMNLHTGDGKKTMVILWWWFPDEGYTSAISVDLFQGAFDAANKAGVDGIGGWNFSGSQGSLADSEHPNVRALWSSICIKNKSLNPPS